VPLAGEDLGDALSGTDHRLEVAASETALVHREFDGLDRGGRRDRMMPPLVFPYEDREDLALVECRRPRRSVQEGVDAQQRGLEIGFGAKRVNGAHGVAWMPGFLVDVTWYQVSTCGSGVQDRASERIAGVRLRPPGWADVFDSPGLTTGAHTSASVELFLIRRAGQRGLDVGDLEGGFANVLGNLGDRSGIRDSLPGVAIGHTSPALGVSVLCSIGCLPLQSPPEPMSKHREILELKRRRQEADGAALLAGDVSMEELGRRNSVVAGLDLPKKPLQAMKAKYVSEK